MRTTKDKIGKVAVTVGPTFLESLTLVFIILKLIHKIDWPWIWVLAPTWIPVALILIIIAAVVGWSVFSVYVLKR